GNANDIFNLTTNIDRPPLAIMLQTARQYYTNTASGVNNDPANGNTPSSSYDLQVVSIFGGGHITDNTGAFIQWTGNKYGGPSDANRYTAASGIDNTEFRYADRILTGDSDLLYGAYINNRVTMSDVWNSQENWTSDWIGYFNGGFNGSTGLAPSTFLQSGSSQHSVAGVGAYLFKDKTWYGELGVYKSVTHGPLSIITAGNGPGASTLIDTSPYIRLAYNKEWGPHSFQVGAHGMVAYAHNNDILTNTYSDWSGSVNTYRDAGLDAQYQYVLEPHYFAAHFRYTHESMNNNATIGANPTDTLNETWADATYIYQAKYGAMLFYHGATGSNDAVLYSSSPTGSPNWQSWMPSLFWAPVQNVRIGYMYTFYTQLGGTSGNSLTAGTSTSLAPHDFNTSMLYATIIY
ncbi:MAG: hypothetical protein KGK17_04955, partial [Betaproteobacteria bacterium]|nr:hypothetical protein [Betaproteobacteria bacterium]